MNFATRLCAATLIGAVCGLTGCQSNAPESSATGANLRPITAPAGGTSADRDRSALARLIGVWDVKGWRSGEDGARQDVLAHAAGVIESEHFVLLTVQATSGQFAGRSARSLASLLFASEPGIGPTLTVWGDASPAINRLTGWTAEDASRFTFTEVKTASGAPRMNVTITFESDDAWVAQFRRSELLAEPVAEYRFTRASR